MRISYICPPGASAVAAGRAPVPHEVLAELRLRGHDADVRETDRLDMRLEARLAAADVAIVHERTAPDLVAALGQVRRGAGRRFLLLFHDAGERSALAPDEIRALELGAYDAALVGGEAAARIYRDLGFHADVRVWREAIDLWRFRPPREAGERRGIISLTDWGDAAHGEDLVRMLLRPAREAELPLTLLGEGYPDEVAEKLVAAGVELGPPPADADLPEIFALALLAIELPPRAVSERLPGAARPVMMRALACGVPLVVARWRDSERLFAHGEELLAAQDAADMTRQLLRLRDDATLRAGLAAQGRLAMLASHSPSHRADELIGLLAELEETRKAAAEAGA